MAETKNIALGSKIKLTVVKTPTNAAAAKTIVRLLWKDPVAKEHDRRLTKLRERDYNPDRRGGRLYGGRVVKQNPVKAVPGSTGTITATADVLAALPKLARFVEVAKA